MGSQEKVVMLKIYLEAHCKGLPIMYIFHIAEYTQNLFHHLKKEMATFTQDQRLNSYETVICKSS